MELSVKLNVRKHVCGTDFCLVDAYATNPQERHETSFSFSLEYLFDYVKEEDRPEFITRVVSQYLNSEVTRFHQQKMDVTYNISNMSDVLVATREIRPKVLDS